MLSVMFMLVFFNRIMIVYSAGVNQQSIRNLWIFNRILSLYRYAYFYVWLDLLPKRLNLDDINVDLIIIFLGTFSW